MTNRPSTSKQSASLLDDDEVFEDSTVLANFNNSSFRDISARFSENNINDSLNKSGLNVSALCCDEELSGYDKLMGQTWVYPTNYSVRDYQFNIIQAALLKNTLVSLPTGLGKTFIAAVVMYNFYRWYPLGKIVFTAPTRPLVAQQIDACYNIVAIPPADTIEMTGHMQVTSRKTHWQTKRVFFATPQVIYNDIKSGICPANLIRCLVVDEAHRARGNYAYCQIVGTLTDMGHKTYRVLALSATPGSKVDDVIQVVKNLHISHLELRTEHCIDVAPYSHTRSVNTVVIPLGDQLSHLRQEYVEILDSYARRLKQLNILPQNVGNMSKGRIVMLYKEFQNKDRSNRHPQHNHIMKDFTLLIALYHGLELLTKHGARVFLNFFDEHPEKSWMQADDRLTVLLERLRDDLGVNPLSLDRSVLPDGTVPEMPKDLRFGHPKFDKLKEIMVDHFTRAKQANKDTRAIVFCEYRESVNLVHCLLLQCRPLIVPMMFVGQGAGGKEGKAAVSQKQQLRVMRAFRAGECTALVATCVAEEGLDVGSVDLIVCFDVSTRSPVRLVQRCGRTGRERSGQVYILVTEGREHQTLVECMRQRDGLNQKIRQSREVKASLYEANPRMVPHGFAPRCQKMFITVVKDNSIGSAQKDPLKGKKGQKDLRTMLLGRGSTSSSTSSNVVDGNLISEEDFKELFPRGYEDTSYFEKPAELWSKNKEAIMSTMTSQQPNTRLSTWLEWQRSLQKTVNIEHSKDTEMLSSLLQYSDAKRFELPASTQNPSFGTQDFASQKIIPTSPKKALVVSSPAKISSPVKQKTKKKQTKIPLVKSPGKRDGDIRALFSTATKSTKNYTKLINDLGIKNDGSIPTSLVNLLVELNLNVNNNDTRKCYICSSICDCAFINKLKPNNIMKPSLMSLLKDPKLPDISLIDDMNVESILRCAKNDISLIETQDIDRDVDVSNVSYLKDNKDCSKNFELEFDFDEPIDLTSPENVEVQDENLDKNFDIGDIEDIFADSSPEEAINKEIKSDNKNVSDPQVKESSDPKEALGFFGLDSIDDIFADSDDSVNNNSPKTPNKHTDVKNLQTPVQALTQTTEIRKTQKSPAENPGSPSILSGRVKTAPSSPILGSQQVKKFKLSTKKNQPQSSTPMSGVKRCLIPNTTTNNTLTEEKSKSHTAQISQMDPTNKSLFTITQLVDMINKTNDKSVLSKTNTTQEEKPSIKEDERSCSPILLTQADKKKMIPSTSKSLTKSKTDTTTDKKSVSLIILESDSESDNEKDSTQVYDVSQTVNEIKASQTSKVPEITIHLDKTPEKSINLDPIASPCSSPLILKRKLTFEDDDDEISESPYFNKRQKTEMDKKKLTLQQKVLAALTSNKDNKTNFNNDASINFMSPCSSPILPSQKENRNPMSKSKYESPIKLNSDGDKDEYVRKNNLEMLQMFRKGSQVSSPKVIFESLLNTPRESQIGKRKLTFEDSDDDFVDGKTEKSKSQKHVNGHQQNGTITNHKVRKKKQKKQVNEFLDLEADLSGDQSDSGDELSADSAGSLLDFICDDDVTHRDDMQAHYIRSVKSPVNGQFKIPALPPRFDKAEVFSQFVEEDQYEMDSFCVDSHIGLTQANDMSDLEVAEMLLEKKRNKKKRIRSPSPQSLEDKESPLVRKKRKVKRKIESDSDED